MLNTAAHLGLSLVEAEVPPYKELYPQGSFIQIASRDDLLEFQGSWRLHHPLNDAQLPYAGVIAQVVGAAFYHGGDVLYHLDAVPGIWHECCLRPIRETLQPKADS